MKNILIIIFSIIYSFKIGATSVQRKRSQIFIPGRYVVKAYETMVRVLASSTASYANNDVGVIDGNTVALTPLINPDIPRNVVVRAQGTGVDVAPCTVKVIGTNYFNKAFSEDFTVGNNQTSQITGTKAFKTITSIVIPGGCEEGGYAAKWFIGRSNKFGLNDCMDAQEIVMQRVDYAVDNSYSPVTFNSTQVELNMYQSGTGPNGVRNYGVYFIPGTNCLKGN